jgi:hypothetical protein
MPQYARQNTPATPRLASELALLGPLIGLNPAHTAEAIEKPEQHENEHRQTKNSAQPSPP